MMIDQFFNPDGSLKSIPVRSAKKIEVLRKIAMGIKPEIIYPEKELNEVLSKFHHDTASLRRHMIEFGITERDKQSNYWLTRAPRQD